MTIAIDTTPPQARNGLISALIVGVGMAAALGSGLGNAYLRKDITLTVAGHATQRTTYARTVAQALAEAGVTLAPTDEVSPPLDTRLAEGMHVVVRPAVLVTLVADGRVMRVESAAATVGDLLMRRGVGLGASDRVTPGPDNPLANGMTIRVVRIEHRIVTAHLRVPYDVRTSKDPSAPRGMFRVIQPGRPGLKERLYEITMADGVVVSKQSLGERLVRTPLDRIIRVGTLIQIASRGPFSGREVLEMVATAYSPFCCRGVDDITSTGLKAGFGVVAVDPTVIPLGSRLYVEGYGYAIAGDVGSGIKGLRIDLGFNTKREALIYGVRRVKVYVLQTR